MLARIIDVSLWIDIWLSESNDDVFLLKWEKKTCQGKNSYVYEVHEITMFFFWYKADSIAETDENL